MITRRATKAGKVRWLARYETPVGREVARTFDRRADAVAWERAVKEAARVGGAGLPPTRAARQVTVAQLWADVSAANVTWEARTRAGYAGVYRRMVAPTWAAVRAVSVTRPDVRAWVARLVVGGRSPATVNHAVVVLSAVMREAVDRGIRADNPTVGVRARAVPPTPGDALTVAEAGRLLAGARESDRAVYLLAVSAGLRFGELAGLNVGDLDQSAGAVRVQRAVVEVSGRQIVKPYPKGGSRRVVGVAPVVLDELMVLADGRAPDAPLWPNSDGGRTYYGVARRRLSSALKRARVEKPGGFHLLRRTAATIALQSGGSVRDIAAMLGHKSPMMTLSRYARPDLGEQRTVSGRIAAAIRTESGHDEEHGTDHP